MIEERDVAQKLLDERLAKMDVQLAEKNDIVFAALDGLYHCESNLTDILVLFFRCVCAQYVFLLYSWKARK